jgi:hypothetical protein
METLEKRIINNKKVIIFNFRLFGKKNKVEDTKVSSVVINNEITVEETTIIEPKEKNTYPLIYHVYYISDKKSKNYDNWKVEREGFNRPLKYFKDREQAILYAKNVSLNMKGSKLFIHRKNGEITKLNY